MLYYIGKSSSHLIEVELDLINNTRCSWFYRKAPRQQLPKGIIDDIQVCAGGNSGRDTCQVSYHKAYDE